jgi:ElaB/YqjD/DUF883 family membrane-anchored ribosome-binding protein
MIAFGAIEEVRDELKKLAAHLEHTEQHFAQVCEQQAAHLRDHFTGELQEIRGHLRTIEERLQERER